MVSIVLWSTVLLSAGYGLLTAYAGWGQIKAREIQSWSAAGMLLAGLLVLTGAILLPGGTQLALTLLLLGLVAIHILAFANGLHMHGKINPRHHLARLALSILFIAAFMWLLGFPAGL